MIAEQVANKEIGEIRLKCNGNITELQSNDYLMTLYPNTLYRAHKLN